MDTPDGKKTPMLGNRHRSPDILLVEICTKAITPFDSNKQKLCACMAPWTHQSGGQLFATHSGQHGHEVP
jgi:hypothetical protein